MYPSQLQAHAAISRLTLCYRCISVVVVALLVVGLPRAGYHCSPERLWLKGFPISLGVLSAPRHLPEQEPQTPHLQQSHGGVHLLTFMRTRWDAGSGTNVPARMAAAMVPIVPEPALILPDPLCWPWI